MTTNPITAHTNVQQAPSWHETIAQEPHSRMNATSPTEFQSMSAQPPPLQTSPHPDPTPTLPQNGNSPDHKSDQPPGSQEINKCNHDHSPGLVKYRKPISKSTKHRFPRRTVSYHDIGRAGPDGEINLPHPSHSPDVAVSSFPSPAGLPSVVSPPVPCVISAEIPESDLPQSKPRVKLPPSVKTLETPGNKQSATLAPESGSLPTREGPPRPAKGPKKSISKKKKTPNEPAAGPDHDDTATDTVAILQQASSSPIEDLTPRDASGAST